MNKKAIKVEYNKKIKLYNEYNKYYYNNSSPKVSDKEFDKLKHDILSLEKKYEFIRNNGGWDNFDYEILEYYPCNNFEQLRQKEQAYIEKLNPSLNDAPSYRTEEF